MSKKEKQNETLQQEPVVEEQDVKQEAAAEPEETAVDPLLSELESLKDQVAGQEETNGLTVCICLQGIINRGLHGWKAPFG